MTEIVDLGDLSGTAAEPVEMTFTYFGVRVRVAPDLSETKLIELYARAAEVELPDDANRRQVGERIVKGAQEQKDYIRAHIHPDDFEAFWQAAIGHRQTFGDLMLVTLRLIGLVTDRDPTGPPSDSSDGRPVTRPSSPSGASKPDDGNGPPGWWPADLPYSPQAANFVEKFEAEGRPDKANMVMLSQEAAALRSASPTG